MQNEHAYLFSHGAITQNGATRQIETLSWNAHPSFHGVFLKNIVTASDTGNTFTCHLVRIDPGCAIGLHTHPDSAELHEVVGGEGVCVIAGSEVPYTPGSMAVMPKGVPHEVRTGEKGLKLLAKFIIIPEAGN